MCGSNPGGCSPKAFVDYLGNNVQSPFIFIMNISDSEYDFNSTLRIKPANTTMQKCSQNVDMPYFKALSCSCSVRFIFICFNFLNFFNYRLKGLQRSMPEACSTPGNKRMFIMGDWLRNCGRFHRFCFHSIFVFNCSSYFQVAIETTDSIDQQS